MSYPIRLRRRSSARSNRRAHQLSGRLIKHIRPKMAQKPSQIAMSAKIMLRMVMIITSSLQHRYRCMSTVRSA